MLNPLFSGTSVGQALDDQRRKARADITALPPDELQRRGLESLLAGLVETYQIAPLVLDWRAKRAKPSNVEIELDGGARSGVLDRAQPGRVIGLPITFSVPFTGAPGLFHWRPSMHAGKPPGGFVWEERRLLSYACLSSDDATVQGDIREQEVAVRRWVSWVNREVIAFDLELPALVRDALQARLDRIRNAEDLVVSLRVPGAALEVPRAAFEHPRRRRLTSRRGQIGANATVPDNMLEQRGADLVRTLVWDDPAEPTLTRAQGRPEAEPPKAGRPPGSGWLIVDGADFMDRYRELREQLSRRPLQREYAQAAHMGPRTVRTYLRRFGLRWPPE